MRAIITYSASYDRFKGGQPANVEEHGGGTLEEVIVPVITLSMPTDEIEVQVETKIVEYSFKQQPVLKLFSKNRSYKCQCAD